MVALIVSMVAGVLVTVVAMLVGVASGGAIWIGLAGGFLFLMGLFAYTGLAILREQARIPVAFPTPGADVVPATEQ